MKTIRLPKIIYHITPSKNLKSIFKLGLNPKMGLRSIKIENEILAVYCFTDMDSLGNALTNWLGDQFDENTKLALLAINTEGLKGNYTFNAEYEITIDSAIPVANIKILSTDVDGYFIK